jgi:hypothetical protein
MSTCPNYTGSGSCDLCQGYGTHPGAGDGQDCPACTTGECPTCHGTGTPCSATTSMESTCR